MRDRKFYADLMQYPSEVTGSFILVVVKIDDKTIKFVVDCGMYQEKPYDSYNSVFPTTPRDVEFVILTHNHVDHNGRLPYFHKMGFGGPIITSEATSMILKKALFDNAKVIHDTSKRKNEAPIYDADDAENVMQLVEPHKFNEPIRVNENITVTLVPNGHLIGAASALVQIHCPGEKKDINIFFTGDYNNKNLFFEVSPLRKWITELPLTIVTESTYGTMNSSDISYVFEGNILRALEEGKTIVIPVFSLGRAQEILYYLKDMQARNSELFKNVPIYYDGKLSFYYTGMYNVIAEKEIVKFFDDKKDFLPLNLEKIEDKLLRRGIVADESCKIIVTTSGMGSYGPAQTYIPAFINKSNALIHFTGYCSEGTLGYNLKFTEKGEIVEVGGVQTVKRADVEFTNEFSAHAKADELIALISSFKNAQFAVVNHGRDDVKEAFAKRILKELDLEHVGILGREYFYRIDQNGFVKGYATKFL